MAHAKAALKQMNAKWTERIEIDTTHFVCQSAGPAENNYTYVPEWSHRERKANSASSSQPKFRVSKGCSVVSTHRTAAMGAGMPD